MNQLDRYIGQHVLRGILIVLVVLVGLFTFFSFIEEIDDIGTQHYGIWQAMQFVALEMPLHIYNLFPTAALLGTLVGLGSLASNSELTVMRAAGVSILRIALAVMQIGWLLTLLAMFIGETLAPYSEQYARHLRATSQAEERVAFNYRHGFWARDGDRFVNIRHILPAGGFGDITLYQVDENQALQSMVYAQSAYYQDNRWHLQNVERITFNADHVHREQLATLAWQAILNPDLIKVVVVKPYKLSSIGLYQYIQYLRDSGQQYAPYELALWQRLSYPLVSTAMIFLAIPFVFGSLRSVPLGQRVLAGALGGISFYMLNQVVTQVGLVYSLNPVTTALFPPLAFLAAGVILMRRGY